MSQKSITETHKRAKKERDTKTTFETKILPKSDTKWPKRCKVKETQIYNKQMRNKGKQMTQREHKYRGTQHYLNKTQYDHKETKKICNKHNTK